MLVRLYAGEIIMGRITEDDVPAKLKARVHKYLVDMVSSFVTFLPMFYPVSEDQIGRASCRERV